MKKGFMQIERPESTYVANAVMLLDAALPL